MRASSLSTVVACSLALALGLPAGGAAAFAPKSKKGDAASGRDPGVDAVPEPAAADGPPRLGRIYVNADALGDAGPVLAGRAMKVAEAGLRQQSVQITDAPAGPELRVVLAPRDSGGYRVEYEIVYDGEVVRDGTGGFDCQLCTEDELVDKVEALAVQVSPKLVVPRPEVEPDVGPDPELDPGVEPNPNETGRDPIGDDEPDGLTGKGKAGIALLVVGGAAAISGVPLLIIQPIPIEDDPEQATMARSTKPLGGILLGVGVAVAITGVALLAVDVKQSKAKKSKASAMVHPWVGRGGGGLGVVGRF